MTSTKLPGDNPHSRATARLLAPVHHLQRYTFGELMDVMVMVNLDGGCGYTVQEFMDLPYRRLTSLVGAVHRRQVRERQAQQAAEAEAEARGRRR